MAEGETTFSGSPLPIVAGYYTLAGSRAGAGEGEAARHPFADRVAAAAAAGFSGIGLLADDFAACLAAGLTAGHMRAILEGNGVAVTEIEFLYHWASREERELREAGRLEDLIYRAADALGIPTMNAGDVRPAGRLEPLDEVAERFGEVCDRAARHGLRVALEFLPWTGIADVATAWEVVRRAGRANGGLNLDVWHHYRGAADDAMVAAVPAERIFAVALSDADPELVGDMIEDTTRRRRLPGAGSFDLSRFLRLVDRMDVRAPLVIEILSDEQNALDVGPAAAAAGAAARRSLAGAGIDRWA